MIEKVGLNQSLISTRTPVFTRALVIGGGITGIQSALDIANCDYEVILVEKQPCIGGHMAQLSETFPTLDCSSCILTPRMTEVAQQSKIKLYTYSEVEDISGFGGEYDVEIRKKARSVIEERCTGCSICIEKCPIRKIPSEFDRGLSTRKAIYIPFPQAVPNIPVIDRANCTYFKKGKCKICQKFCEAEAIDFEQEDEIVTVKVGSIVIATGYELYPIEKIGEYGYGKYKDVINGLQFERLLSASGPTGGEIRRPSDDQVPQKVVFVSCVGSRDSEQHLPYWSKICCMYTAKHAMLYKHRVPDGEAVVFYIDVRTGGKGYYEFVTKAQEEDEVLYIRGKVSKIFKDGNGFVVLGADTLSGKQVEVTCDMVVLAMAVVPSKDILRLLDKLKITADEHGFITEVHSRLRPVETPMPGVYMAGCAQAPKDIPEAVAQASGAASKVIEQFAKG